MKLKYIFKKLYNREIKVSMNHLRYLNGIYDVIIIPKTTSRMITL